jgi:hypothetical protein
VPGVARDESNERRPYGLVLITATVAAVLTWGAYVRWGLQEPPSNASDYFRDLRRTLRTAGYGLLLGPLAGAVVAGFAALLGLPAARWGGRAARGLVVAAGAIPLLAVLWWTDRAESEPERQAAARRALQERVAAGDMGAFDEPKVPGLSIRCDSVLALLRSERPLAPSELDRIEQFGRKGPDDRCIGSDSIWGPLGRRRLQQEPLAQVLQRYEGHPERLVGAWEVSEGRYVVSGLDAAERTALLDFALRNGEGAGRSPEAGRALALAVVFPSDAPAHLEAIAGPVEGWAAEGRGPVVVDLLRRLGERDGSEQSDAELDFAASAVRWYLALGDARLDMKMEARGALLRGRGLALLRRLGPGDYAEAFRGVPDWLTPLLDPAATESLSVASVEELARVRKWVELRADPWEARAPVLAMLGLLADRDPDCPSLDPPEGRLTGDRGKALYCAWALEALVGTGVNRCRGSDGRVSVKAGERMDACLLRLRALEHERWETLPAKVKAWRFRRGPGGGG